MLSKLFDLKQVIIVKVSPTHFGSFWKKLLKTVSNGEHLTNFKVLQKILQSVTGITKGGNIKLLQSVTGITKCNSY